MGVKCKLGVAGEKLGRRDKIKSQVVVGTPGKIEEWIKKKNFSLKHLRIFCLDEADEMIQVSRNDILMLSCYIHYTNVTTFHFLPNPAFRLLLRLSHCPSLLHGRRAS